MTFMQGLKDNAFDLCIADPPYGIDIANNPLLGVRRQNFKRRGNIGTIKHQIRIFSQNYLEFLRTKLYGVETISACRPTNIF